ncbi:unnamed protein product [Rotaria sp. Silwood2]|nr:unnamed protein product [Rotaria sp. Silwood2]CAF3116367.1 unnamed protein product [Rotaria sp. Silwood2]CAF4103295.1 unnamed protein product [Rotaria sp. Silwood2]CAF4473130.1 unnamed protein product [Rotaria sp. Silwood2]CAF4768580.1 unnamed protein product [Rotaria sp. Silwood2]
MQLNVREKLIQRQIMNLSQDTFIENETLTIEYESILLNDSRINIKQNNEAFSLFIKDLQLSDQRVYSLESKYLILDTSFINVLPKPQQPTVQIEHEETTITIQVLLYENKFQFGIDFFFSQMQLLLILKIDTTEKITITQQPAE